MPESPLVALIEQYRAGLEAELVILRKLEQSAAQQREASAAQDFGALNRAADERDGLMAALVNIEGQLRVVRQTLSGSREEAKHLCGYAEAVKLHREAIALVSGILTTDGESLDALAAAELARRETARAVEQGETTLAAYRRVMTALPGATLVDRRG
jgi:DNA-binding TFAR19-related protein (PDSD5 family)